VHRRQDTPLEPEQRAALREALLRELPLSEALLAAAVAAVESGMLHSAAAFMQRQRAGTPEAQVAWEAKVGAPPAGSCSGAAAASASRRGAAGKHGGPNVRARARAAGAVHAAARAAGGGAAAAQLPGGEGAGARPAAAALQPLRPLVRHQAAAAPGARLGRRCGAPRRPPPPPCRPPPWRAALPRPQA
jgi:hypothetical protein